MAKQINKEIIEERKKSPFIRETKALREKVIRDIPHRILGYNLKQFYCDRTYFRQGATRKLASTGKIIKKGIETLLIWGKECPKGESPNISISQIDFTFVRSNGKGHAYRTTDYINIEVDEGHGFDILYQRDYKETSDIAVWSLERVSDHGW